MKVDAGSLVLEERVVGVNRVAKVHKGGRRLSFSALVVVGDKNGHVGAGLGKAGDVASAIRKGIEHAKKNLISVPITGTTIPHEVTCSVGATTVLLKPASSGTGVIAGGAARAVLGCAGVSDVLSKCIGSTNPINTVRATINCLKDLRTRDVVAKMRDKPIEAIGVGAVRYEQEIEDKAGK